MCCKLNRRFKSKCVTEINESKTLTKHISCKCKCGFDGRNAVQINGGITINLDVNVKNVMFWILLQVVVKMENI